MPWKERRGERPNIALWLACSALVGIAIAILLAIMAFIASP
jgi:hypothetical protein